MRNRLVFLITLQLLLPLLLTKQAFAEQEQTISIYSPEYNDVVITYLFDPSYTPSIAPSIYQSEYIQHIQRLNITFPSSISGKDVFLFQDLENNKKYSFNDPSLFIPNIDNFDYKQMTLVNTITNDLNFNIEKIDDNNFLVSITSTDEAINFDKYSQKYLQTKLIGNDTSYSSPTTNSTNICNQFYCGTVSAQFNDVLSGNYDLEINYGPEAIAYIKNALKIIRPTLTPTTNNSTILNTPNLPTSSHSQATKSISDQNLVITPTIKSEISLPKPTHKLESIKTQNISLIEAIFNYIKSVLNEIRSKI